MAPFFKNKHQPHSMLPFHYVPGPVFTEPAMAAIYVTDLGWPAQRVLGGGYPLEGFIRPLQPAMLVARPASILQGVGIQNGQLAVSSLTAPDGSYLDGEDDNIDDFAAPTDFHGGL